jgi:hypothetical protein
MGDGGAAVEIKSDLCRSAQAGNCLPIQGAVLTLCPQDASPASEGQRKFNKVVENRNPPERRVDANPV